MGWSSWNCYVYTVTDDDIRKQAKALVDTGLADHGYGYVNIDDFWQNNPWRFKEDKTLQGAERKPDGTINPNGRFPNMKALADYIHSFGFKAGIYSSPGPYTCGMCTGSWGYEWRDAKTYADWGFDFLKYDRCTYASKKFRGEILNNPGMGRGLVNETHPYRLMGEAIKAQNRDIVFSLCQYGLQNVQTWGENVGGQCWRTTGDLRDTYPHVANNIDRQVDYWPYARPGAWNDMDMLVVGTMRLPSSHKFEIMDWHKTNLTPNEHYTHVSMWAILCSPLVIGCDLTRMDDFTRALLTNDEVIEVNQDELGAQAALVAKGPRAQVWAKPMSDGSFVFALRNLHEEGTRISIDFEAQGLKRKWLVRDLWRQKDVGIYGHRYAMDVPGHMTYLVRLFPRQGARLAEGISDIRMNSLYLQVEERRPVDKPGYKELKNYPCEKCGNADEVYLFSYFTRNGQDGMRFAFSRDGLDWKPIAGGRPILAPKVGKDKLMRDPSICQGPDGTYHLVWTSSWKDRIIGHASSKDLINWSDQQTIPVMMHEPEAKNSWAPEVTYNPDDGLFYIYWATTIPGRHAGDGVNERETKNNHRIYLTTTRDWKIFSPTRIWYNPSFSVIDSALIKVGGEWMMVAKNENDDKKDIFTMRSKSLAGDWTKCQTNAISVAGNWIEGPSPLKIGNDIFVYFDRYTKKCYGAVKSSDGGKSWVDVSDRVSFPRGTRHGTAFAVPKAIADGLLGL